MSFRSPGALVCLGFVISGCASSAPSARSSSARPDGRPLAATSARGTTPVLSRSVAPRPELSCEIARVESGLVWLPIGRRDGVTGHDRFFVDLEGQTAAELLVENLWEHGCLARQTCGPEPLHDGLRARRDPELHFGKITANLTRLPAIDVDFDDVDLRDAMAAISSKAKATIIVYPDVHQTVSISLRHIPWRDAVAVIAKMTCCEVDEDTPGVLRLSYPE